MNAMMEICISTLTQGFIYALLSYGVYITYKILDFPDLTVDGSFPLGAAVTAIMLVKGVNPFVTLLAALFIGARVCDRLYPCKTGRKRSAGRYHHHDSIVLHQPSDCRLQLGN